MFSLAIIPAIDTMQMMVIIMLVSIKPTIVANTYLKKSFMFFLYFVLTDISNKSKVSLP
jgi:hypothetical protein